MRNNNRARLLAYVTGMVNQRLLLQCEYLVAGNRIVRCHLCGRPRLAHAERSTLAQFAKRLGQKWLAEVAFVAKVAARRRSNESHPASCRCDSDELCAELAATARH